MLMKSGDLVFFTKYDDLWILSKLIKWWTQCDYIHVGILLKDPKFLGLKGVYIWQTDSLGSVTITPFTSNRKYWIRNYIGVPLNNENLDDIFKITNGKPYDKSPMDWIKAMIGNNFQPQITNSFWCSALVGCILTKLKILDNKTDWSIMSPTYLADIKLNCYT